MATVIRGARRETVRLLLASSSVLGDYRGSRNWLQNFRYGIALYEKFTANCERAFTAVVKRSHVPLRGICVGAPLQV